MGPDPASFFANLFLAHNEADWVKAQCKIGRINVQKINGCNLITQWDILNFGNICSLFHAIARDHHKISTMKKLTYNIIDFNHLDSTTHRQINYLCKDMGTLFSGEKVKPGTFELLTTKLEKMKKNMLPKHLFPHLFYYVRTSRTINECQFSARFFVFDDRHAHEINYVLSAVYLLKKKKDFNLSEKFDFFCIRTRFLNQHLGSENFDCIFLD